MRTEQLSRTLRISAFLLLYACLCVLPLFSIAHAACPTISPGAGGFVPLECFSDSPRFADTYTTGMAEGGLPTFLNKVFAGAIALGGILAVLRLAWAGFVYMGSDAWGQKEHAKEIIQDALIGLFLLIGIWLILYQINPDILKLNVNITNLSNTSQSGAQSVDETGFSGFTTQNNTGASGVDEAGFNTRLTNPEDIRTEQTGATCIVMSTDTGRCTSWKYAAPVSGPVQSNEQTTPDSSCASGQRDITSGMCL